MDDSSAAGVLPIWEFARRNPNMKSSIGWSTAILLLAMCTAACNKRPLSPIENTPERTSDPRVQTTASIAIPANEFDQDSTLEQPQTPLMVLDQKQRSHILSIVSAMERVIKNQTTVEHEEKTLLGEGLYYWPKDPTHPIMLVRYYQQENFDVRWMALSFTRRARNSPWARANLTIYPSSFPLQIYDLQISADFFTHYTFERVALEIRPHQRIETPRVFYFVHKTLPHVRMRIETSPDATSPDSKYPSAFYSIVLSAGDE
jgi:hypothetical protein